MSAALSVVDAVIERVEGIVRVDDYAWCEIRSDEDLIADGVDAVAYLDDRADIWQYLTPIVGRDEARHLATSFVRVSEFDTVGARRCSVGCAFGCVADADAVDAECAVAGLRTDAVAMYLDCQHKTLSRPPP